MFDTESPAGRLQAALDRIAAHAKAPAADPAVTAAATEVATRLDKLIAMVREALDATPADALAQDA